MLIEILGSAAGGGFPQWNCGCRSCQSLRAGTFPGKRRTQTQVAVSSDGNSWFLLNASPDLRQQIEATPALHPRDGKRDSPIAGVVLPSADLDQVAGLLSLRELHPFRIYCTNSIRRILQEHNNVFGMLNRIPVQASWTDIKPGESFLLQGSNGIDSGVKCEPISAGSRYPVYVSSKVASGWPGAEASLGFILGSAGGKQVAYLPAVAELNDALIKRLNDVDLLLFDGTFWTDDELIQVQGSGATAREMGHIPISSTEGTLRMLSGLTKPRKVFIHVNNTNPMLDESSAQFREVRNAGWEVAEDGWRFDLFNR